jgi:hypothetical protein
MCARMNNDIAGVDLRISADTAAVAVVFGGSV